MKAGMLSALVSAGALLAAAPAVADTRAIADRMVNTSEVMVIAHRACWNGAPENSIAAIEACVRLGVDMIELDVRNTADGALVLMHDESLERTTEATGPLSGLTLDQVTALRLRDGAGGADAALTDQTVPTLEQALVAARGRVMVNLDLKVQNEAEVMALLDRLGMADQVLMKLTALPDAPRMVNAPFLGRTHFMPILGRCAEGGRPPCTMELQAPLAAYEAYRPVAYEISFLRDRAFLQSVIASPRPAGTRIWVNVLGEDDRLGLADPDGVWGALIRDGVSMLQTDEPEAVMEYLGRRP